MHKLPDHETHMAEVNRLARETRDPARQTATEARQPGVVAPIVMAPESEVIPERYVIHYSFTQCSNCGNAVRDSEFYALSYLRSRINGTRVRHLTKCTSARYNVPVDRILTGCFKVPYCQACDQIDLSHLPPPPQATLLTLAEPVLKGQKPKDAKEPKPTKKAASLEDLI